MRQKIVILRTNRKELTMKKYAKVTQLSPVRITFDGESLQSTASYNRLTSYTPALNDRIVVDVEDGKYLILGKVVK